MTDSLTRARQEIDTLLAQLRLDLDAHASSRLADLTRREADLDRREAELAHAAELASTDTAVAAAWQQAQAAERLRVQRLIALQLDQLSPHCASRTVLEHLGRLVEGEQ